MHLSQNRGAGLGGGMTAFAEPVFDLLDPHFEVVFAKLGLVGVARFADQFSVALDQFLVAVTEFVLGGRHFDEGMEAFGEKAIGEDLDVGEFGGAEQDLAKVFEIYFVKRGLFVQRLGGEVINGVFFRGGDSWFTHGFDEGKRER